MLFILKIQKINNILIDNKKKENEFEWRIHELENEINKINEINEININVPLQKIIIEN